MDDAGTTLRFVGVAHPNPHDAPAHPACMSAAELKDLDVRELPVLVEHDCEAPVGWLTSAWVSANGELRVVGVVKDADAIAKLKGGELKQLAFGMNVTYDTRRNVLSKRVTEVSLCKASILEGNNIEQLFAANGDRIDLGTEG